jgi:hypothetical protein
MLSLFRQSSPVFEDVFAPVAQGSESPEAVSSPSTAVPKKRRAYDPVKRREQYRRSLERKQALSVKPEEEDDEGSMVCYWSLPTAVATHDGPLEKKKADRRSYSKKYYAAKKKEKQRLREQLAQLQRGREEPAGETTDGLDTKRSIPLPSQTIRKIFAVTTDGQIMCLYERP